LHTPVYNVSSIVNESTDVDTPESPSLGLSMAAFSKQHTKHLEMATSLRTHVCFPLFLHLVLGADQYTNNLSDIMSKVKLFQSLHI
jgi:hypothetical protein